MADLGWPVSYDDDGHQVDTARVRWEEPIPLGASACLPAFPVAAFPGWLAAQVEECARFTQTPPTCPRR